MTAKLTLEFEDETAPGFEQLVKNFEQAENAGHGMANATNQSNRQLALMQQQQTSTIAAIEQNTLAIHENRDSWIEVTNTLAEFSRNAAGAARAVAHTTAEVTKSTAEFVGINSASEAAAFALKTVALRAAGIAVPVAAATVGFKAYEAILRSTGKEVIATNEANQNLADSINRGHTTIQAVMARTGKSAEELGLTVENNWDRTSSATSRFASRMGGNVSIIAREGAKLTGIPQLAEAAWEGFDSEMTRFTGNFTENLDLAADKIDEFLGLNSELREAQEKAAEEEARRAKIRRNMAAFEESVKQEIALTQDLTEIKNSETQKQLRAIEVAERKRRVELRESDQFKGRLAKESNARLRAILEQEEQLRRDKLRRQEEAVRRSAEQRKKIREQELQEIQEQAEKEAEIRREAEEKKQRIIEQFEKGRRSLLEQRQDHFFESIQKRLEMQEGNEKKILEIQKEAAKVRAQTDIAAAESEEEILKIRFELERRLRELDLQHKIDMEQKKSDAAEKSKQKELEDERKKIQALKRMQNEQGQNAFQAVVGQQSREKVLQELVQNRIEEADQEDPDLSDRRQRRRNVQIRRQVVQQAQTGQLNPGEVAQAQGDLAARQILQAKQQGKLSEEMLRAMAEQAQAFGEQARTQEQLVEESREFKEFVRQQSQDARQRGQRLRNQRRGMR